MKVYANWDEAYRALGIHDQGRFWIPLLEPEEPHPRYADYEYRSTHESVTIYQDDECHTSGPWGNLVTVNFVVYFDNEEKSYVGLEGLQNFYIDRIRERRSLVYDFSETGEALNEDLHIQALLDKLEVLNEPFIVEGIDPNDFGWADDPSWFVWWGSSVDEKASLATPFGKNIHDLSHHLEPLDLHLLEYRTFGLFDPDSSYGGFLNLNEYSLDSDNSVNLPSLTENIQFEGFQNRSTITQTSTEPKKILERSRALALMGHKLELLQRLWPETRQKIKEEEVQILRKACPSLDKAILEAEKNPETLTSGF